MSRRKVFKKTDLSVGKNDLPFHASDMSHESAEAIPTSNTLVTFLPNPSGTRSFDFGPFYGVGIDPIVYASQRQVERFLNRQDGDLQVTTIVGYCDTGLRSFFEYLTVRSSVIGRQTELGDIDRNVLDGYLDFLGSSGSSRVTQKTVYDKAKPVLKALCRRGLIHEIVAGDDATFPRNPFPSVKRSVKGEAPLSKAERKTVSRALRASVTPLFQPNVVVTGELLVYAYLFIALSTGRNTVPLLEMPPDCLQSHPRDNTLFLLLYKRRGHNTNKVAIRNEAPDERVFESISTIRPSVVGVVRRAIELSQSLRAEAPPHLQNRVWLFRARAGMGAGTVKALNEDTLADGIRALVQKHSLVDSDGRPLRLNVSRLRKTFVNRIYELSDGDIMSAAVAAGNTVNVVQTSYLRPGEDAQKNWRFMGIALVNELISGAIGATERTPVGGCSDPKGGEYAPKRQDAFCMSFLNCLRCRNYVVTGDDLYKLFSFYWRLLEERGRMARRRWELQFAHIVRLIDRDVIEAGLRKGIFKQAIVDATRTRARIDPHPFWANVKVIGDLEALR